MEKIGVDPKSFKQMVAGIMVDRELSDPKDCLDVAHELYTELFTNANNIKKEREITPELEPEIDRYKEFKASFLKELDELVHRISGSSSEQVDIPGINRVIEILQK